MRYLLTIFIFSISVNILLAQDDSVDVTFFYYPNDNPSSVYLRGEFNNWDLNNPMTLDPGSSSWFATPPTCL